MGALSTELFGIPLGLRDFPRVKSLRGLGTSDSSQYAKRLTEVFDYRNTFYDREPRFDLGIPSEESNTYDFLLSSDVLEHVAPPIEQAFRNDEYFWWQIAEYSYDTFMIRSRTRT